MASEDIKMTVEGKQLLIPQEEKFYNITKLFLIVPRSRRSLGPLPFYSPMVHSLTKRRNGCGHEMREDELRPCPALNFAFT